MPAYCNFFKILLDKWCPHEYNNMCVTAYGEVSEWFKELVLKTSDTKVPWVRIPPSPPRIAHSARLSGIRLIKKEREPYLTKAALLTWRNTQVGRRGAPAKGVGRVTGARVRISLSPPVKPPLKGYEIPELSRVLGFFVS